MVAGHPFARPSHPLGVSWERHSTSSPPSTVEVTEKLSPVEIVELGVGKEAAEISSRCGKELGWEVLATA